MARRNRKTSPSEVHAYIHIFDQLTKKKEWDKDQIFTQQECNKIKSIAECLGETKPENIVQIAVKVSRERREEDEGKKKFPPLKPSRPSRDNCLHLRPLASAVIFDGAHFVRSPAFTRLWNRLKAELQTSK